MAEDTPTLPTKRDIEREMEATHAYIKRLVDAAEVAKLKLDRLIGIHNRLSKA